jgi:DNA-binding HxlR family transcriptional regulator
MYSRHLKLPTGDPTNGATGDRAAAAVPAAALPAAACEVVNDVLAHLGDKWAGLALLALADGALRTGDLRRQLGVSQKVLTATLRGLERDGYVARAVTPTVPPRVHYALTAMGRGVLVPLGALATWALGQREQVEAARRAYDAREAASTPSGAR